jgi:serine/threonine protein kinase
MATLAAKDSRHICMVHEHSGKKLSNPLAFEIDIITEYLPSLDTYINEKGITLAGAVRLGIDACEALRLCHENNVIHGGIKEKNIFVVENPGRSAGKEISAFKLGDIGLSRILWDPTDEAQNDAAPYTAPEVFKGEYAEESADIYAVGIILFKLFNDLRMPFMPLTPAHTQVDNNGAAEQRRRSGEIPPMPRKSGDRLGAIICKACGQKDRRHKTAKAFKDELSKYLDTLTESEKAAYLIHPPGVHVPGRRAMGQARASSNKNEGDEDERAAESRTREPEPRTRGRENAAEQAERQPKRGTERLKERSAERNTEGPSNRAAERTRNEAPADSPDSNPAPRKLRRPSELFTEPPAGLPEQNTDGQYQSVNPDDSKDVDDIQEVVFERLPGRAPNRNVNRNANRAQDRAQI